MAAWSHYEDAPRQVKQDPRTRWPSVYDTCPDCGGPGPKAKKGYRCKSCTPLTRGEDAPQWKGDAAREETKRERAQGFYPELGTCERCEEAPATDRHHIDGDTGHNDRSNLMFLCRRCHMQVDGRMQNLKQFQGPDPKPQKRHRATKAEWTEIRQELLKNEFAYASCVCCGDGRDVSLHHVLPRSQGGGDVVQNLVVLCGDGTRGCHGLLESHGHGWERVAASIRQYVVTDNARRRYQEEHAGESFNRRYPCLPNTSEQFQEDFRAIYRLESDDVEGHSRP